MLPSRRPQPDLRQGELAVLPVHWDTGDRFGGAITHFHLPKDEGTSAHARRGERADPTSVLEVQIAGQMSMLRRGARNLRA
jgi:hypothetical protein